MTAMFKVFRNGVHHSVHGCYADACRLARIQAGKDRQAYFTVHGCDTGKPLYKADAIRGLVTFIVSPMTPEGVWRES